MSTVKSPALSDCWYVQSKLIPVARRDIIAIASPPNILFKQGIDFNVTTKVNVINRMKLPEKLCNF